MNILMINGTMRKQSTYNTGRILAENIAGENDTVEEIFLPEALPHFCMGCATCIISSEEKCPHYEYTSKLTEKIDAADVLIFTTPVFVFHTTGQMKTLLDHYAYRWMVHRPSEKMFSKQAVIIATAAGGGTKSTIKDIKDSLFYWGVGRIYTYGSNVAAASWNGVKDKKRNRIESDIKKLAEKIKRKSEKVKPSFSVRMLFNFIRLMQKGGGFNKVDNDYWRNNGWLDGKKPR